MGKGSERERTHNIDNLEQYGAVGGQIPQSQTESGRSPMFRGNLDVDHSRDPHFNRHLIGNQNPHVYGFNQNFQGHGLNQLGAPLNQGYRTSGHINYPVRNSGPRNRGMRGDFRPQRGGPRF